MKQKPTYRSLANSLGIIALSIATQQLARADVQTWWGAGATANWSDPSGNWTNAELAASVPATGDDLIFANLTQATSINDISALSVNSITFTAGNFDFSGNTLAIANGITNSSGDNVFDLPLTVGASQNFEVDAQSLTFNQGIDVGGNALNLAGSGNINLNGAVSGAGTLVMSSTGTLLVTNRQPLTGGIVVNSGIMQVSTPGNLDFGGALTPSLITVNTNGTIYGTTTHAIGGGTPLFINRGIWQLDAEDYKTNITMWDGTIEPGPSPNSSGGELRVGFAGGSGTYTWNVSNSITGSTISSPLNTIGSTVNLILNVSRGLAASDLTISGNIKNGGNITVTGNGITTLSGDNTQSGTFTIVGGTVALMGTLSSSAIVLVSNAVFDISSASFSLDNNSVLSGTGTVLGTLYDYNSGVTGAALSPGGNGTAGTLMMGGVNLSGNGLALNFDLANNPAVGGGTNDLIIATNFNASAGVPNVVNISFLNGTPKTGVAYTLIKYGNGFSGDPSQFLTAQASRYVYTFTNDLAAGAIEVIVSGQPANLVWKGDGAANAWDTGGTTNWFNVAPNKDVFLAGDNVTFNDVGSNTPSVFVTGAVLPTTVTIDSTKDYVFAGSGKISNGARFIKSNSGNLTILTPDDNSGGGSFNGAGVVTVGNGGTNVANIGSGPLTNNTSVTFFESASPTYSGNMSGAGSLTAFVPGGTLTLTGTNTFTGGLTVAAGTVQIGNNSAGASVITNYGTLNLYRADAFTNQNLITSAGNTLEYGNGDINLRGAGGMTVDGSGSIDTTPAGSFSVGQSAAGKLTVNSGGVINIGLNFLLGNPNAAGDYGAVVQNGGTITVGNQFRIGHWASEISSNIMNGGVLNVPNNQLAVGWDGIGLMTLNGGVVNCRTLNVDDNGNTAAINGINSTFTMNGGVLNIGPGGIGGNTATNALVPTIVLSGGTIGTLASSALVSAGWSSTMNLRLTNGTPTLDTSNATVTLSGVLSGDGGLTKVGSGNLNLNGANTFAGTTTVANGTLQGTGVTASPIVVQSGANLSAGTTLSVGTFTVSNATMNSGASLVIDASSTSSASDLVYAKGTLGLDTATPLIMNFLGGTPYTAAPYTVVSNLLARSGHVVLAPSSLTRYAATVDESDPNSIRVSFTGTNGNLVWQGNVSSNWNVNGDANWLNGGVADKYYQSDVVLFNDSGISQSNVNLSATVTPAGLTVDTAGNYTFTGSPIAGLTALTKSGSGTLTLLNSNAYSGLTTIAGGTLQVGNGGTSGYLSSGTVADYGTLVFDRADTVNFNGVLNGPGRLVQAGSGTLLITATENHYGGTTVNPGATIQLGNGALGDLGSLGSSTVINNGTINFDRLSNVGVATPYTGNGAFNFLGTGNSGQSGYVLNATNTFTGPVTLSYARIQSGAGAQSFGSPSSITVNPGSAVYATATAASPVYNMPLILSGTGWQDGLGALRMEGNGTWAGNITLAANARVETTSASTNTIAGNITGNYELESSGNNASGATVLAPASANTFNALRISGTAGNKTIAGNANAIPDNIPLTMNAGTLWLNGYDKTFSSFVNLSGSSSIQNGSTTSPATVTLMPVLGGSAYNGTFADGATQPLNVTFTQTPGQWTLNLPTASPNWTGNLTNNGGTIYSGTQNTPFGSQGVPGRSIVGNNAVFLTTINNALNGFNGHVMLNNSTWLCNRYISCAAVGSLYLANSTITGTNSSDGSYENWSLPGMVMVRGTGPSYLSGFGSSSAFDLQSGGTTFDVADATGNAGSDLIVGGGGSTTFLHSPSATSSGGSLIKTGAGTLELDGANTYSGSTTINAGTLKLGASGTLLSTSISIASGATLDISAISGGLTLMANEVVGGSGTVNGSLTDAYGTEIEPGDSNPGAGTLTIVNDLTLNGGGNLVMDLANTSTTGGGVNDLIQVNGNLNLYASLPITVNFNFLNGAPALGVPYTLLKCNGTITGTAADVFTNSPTRYSVTYGQTANTITVTFTGSTSNLVWTGSDPYSPGIWDVAVSTNWSNGSGADVFYQFDGVRFDDSSMNTLVTLNSTVTPASITVDSTNDYTFTGTGAIAGNTGITKNNTNTLVLQTVNTFTGPVNVNSGTFALGINDSLPVGTVVTVSNGAAFDFADFNGNTTTRGNTFIIAGAGPTGQGSLVDSVNGGGIYSYANVSNLILTADSVIGGIERWDIGPLPNSEIDGQGHNLTIIGTGSIDLRPQTITNVASITISNALTWYESFSQTNAWTATTTNYVCPGSSLGIYGGQAVNMPIVLTNATILNQGSGTPQWVGPITVQGTNLFNNNGAQAFSGVISGPGAISVGGASTTAGVNPAILTFSNANTFVGGVIMSNAPVTKGNATAVAGFAGVVVTSTNGLGTGPIVFDLSLMTTNTTTNTARLLECNIQGGGVLPNDMVLPASSTLVKNVGIQGHDSSSSFTLSGQISGGYAGLTNWIDFGDSASSGVMRLANNANNFIANLYCDRGVLAVTGDGCLGDPANLLKLDQSSLNGGLRFDASDINVAHSVIVNSTATLDVFGDNDGDGWPETPNNTSISGSISGGGAFTVKCGANNSPSVVGSLTLSGNNTFSGALTIAGSTKLIASSATALGTTGAGTTVNTGGTLSLNLGGAYSSESLTLNGAGVGNVGALENKGGDNVLNGNISLASATTIGVTSGSLTLGGVISGANPLTIQGTGVLTLNGANAFSAGTTVGSGTLLVNGSLPAGNVVNVGSGASLGGMGVINGPVVVQSGAVIQPGAGGVAVGALTVNGPLALAGNTVMFLDKSSSANSQIGGASSVTYGGTLSVTNLAGTLAAGDKFVLFSVAQRQGSFATINLPALDSGLAWSNSLAIDGSIQVVGASTTAPVNITYSVSGGALTLSWPFGDTGWRLMVQTNNLAAGISANTNDWTTVVGSTATNRVSLPIDVTKPAEFYRLVSP